MCASSWWKYDAHEVQQPVGFSVERGHPIACVSLLSTRTTRVSRFPDVFQSMTRNTDTRGKKQGTTRTTPEGEQRTFATHSGPNEHHSAGKNDQKTKRRKLRAGWPSPRKRNKFSSHYGELTLHCFFSSLCCQSKKVSISKQTSSMASKHGGRGHAEVTPVARAATSGGTARTLQLLFIFVSSLGVDSSHSIIGFEKSRNDTQLPSRRTRDLFFSLRKKNQYGRSEAPSEGA